MLGGFSLPLWISGSVHIINIVQERKKISKIFLILSREEKSEQLADAKHEVEQLTLELQKIKQEVRWAHFTVTIFPIFKKSPVSV